MIRQILRRLKREFASNTNIHMYMYMDRSCDIARSRDLEIKDRNYFILG